MRNHPLAWVTLATLLLTFALLVLLSSGRLVDPIQEPQPTIWNTPVLSTVSPSPTPTPGWWQSILTPTALPTQLRSGDPDE